MAVCEDPRPASQLAVQRRPLRPGRLCTCGAVSMALVSLDVLRSVTVGRVEEIDVLIVVAGQEFCKDMPREPSR